MNLGRPLRGAVIAIALTAALASCAATAPSSGGSASSDRLSVAFDEGTTTLDPASGCTLADSQLTRQLYVQLLQYGSKSGPDGTNQVDPTKTLPYLSKSHTVSADGKSYTFTLNSGWTFPSGKPVDAAAVKYSLERAITIAGCGSAIVNDLYLAPTLIKSIDVTSSTELTINLAQADAAFPLAMATTAASIVDKSLVDAHGGIEKGKPNTWAATNSIGSGPYRLASYSAGDSAQLVASKTFKGTAPATSTISIKYVKSDPTLLLQAKNGTNDVTFGLAKTSAKSLESNSGTKVVAYSGTANMQLLTPNDKAPWTNEKVREAVTYAIPYEAIQQKVLSGFGSLYYGPIPPTMPGFSASESAARTEDLTKAKSLMASAGVKSVNVTLTTLAGDSNQAAIATILQASLKDIGITVKIQPLDESAWSDAVYNHKAQTALRLDGPAIFSPGYYLQYDEACGIVYNTVNVCVPANTALLAKARASSDSAVQDAAYAELTKNWVAASPKAILYLDADPVVLSKSVTAFSWSPDIDMRTWKK